jgi:hypothetical protein
VGDSHYIDRAHRGYHVRATDAITPRSSPKPSLGGDAEVLAGSPADFGNLIAAETEKWRQGGQVLGREAGVILVRYSITFHHEFNSHHDRFGDSLIGHRRFRPPGYNRVHP